MAGGTFVSYYFHNARYYKNYDEILPLRLNDTNNKYEAEYDENYDENYNEILSFRLDDTNNKYETEYDKIYDEVFYLCEYNWYNCSLYYC